MNDLISRQQAIDAMRELPYGYRGIVWDILNSLPSVQQESFEWCHDCKEYDQAEHCCHRWTKVIRQTVEELKSAQPEQKRGRWIVIMNEPNITFDECKCSECGVIEYFNKGWKKFSFCPNCGARMEENNG